MYSLRASEKTEKQNVVGKFSNIMKCKRQTGKFSGRTNENEKERGFVILFSPGHVMHRIKSIFITDGEHTATHGEPSCSLRAALALPFSAGALVEPTKPCEIGMVSRIPQEHLRRRVFYSLSPSLSHTQ